MKNEKKVNNTKHKKKKKNQIGLVGARVQAIVKASLDPMNCYKKSS